MLVRSPKLQRLDYFDFASENFSLVRFGSEVNYPETVFSHIEILFIVSLLFPALDLVCSMWNTQEVQQF